MLWVLVIHGKSRRHRGALAAPSGWADLHRRRYLAFLQREQGLYTGVEATGTDYDPNLVIMIGCKHYFVRV
jgi:hypothetical protein